MPLIRAEKQTLSGVQIATRVLFGSTAVAPGPLPKTSTALFSNATAALQGNTLLLEVGTPLPTWL
jgi:hypothetical protein